MEGNPVLNINTKNTSLNGILLSIEYSLTSLVQHRARSWHRPICQAINRKSSHKNRIECDYSIRLDWTTR